METSRSHFCHKPFKYKAHTSTNWEIYLAKTFGKETKKQPTDFFFFFDGVISCWMFPTLHSLKKRGVLVWGQNREKEKSGFSSVEP